MGTHPATPQSLWFIECSEVSETVYTTNMYHSPSCHPVWGHEITASPPHMSHVSFISAFFLTHTFFLTPQQCSPLSLVPSRFLLTLAVSGVSRESRISVSQVRVCLLPVKREISCSLEWTGRIPNTSSLCLGPECKHLREGREMVGLELQPPEVSRQLSQVEDTRSHVCLLLLPAQTPLPGTLLTDLPVVCRLQKAADYF